MKKTEDNTVSIDLDCIIEQMKVLGGELVLSIERNFHNLAPK